MGEACPNESTFEIMMSMSAVEVSGGEGFNDGYDYAWTVAVVVRVHGAKAQQREPDELWFSWLANPGTYWRYTLCTALVSFSFLSPYSQ